MHPQNQIRRAGAVQLPGKGKHFRCPHRAAAPVAHHILCRLVIRLDQAGNEVPAAVDQGKGRFHRLVQDQRAGIVVEHNPRLATDEGQVENRLPRPVPGIEDRAIGVPHGIGGGVHPAAADNPCPKACENAAIIGHLQIVLLGGWVHNVHAEVIPQTVCGKGRTGAAPVVDVCRPSHAGGIQKAVVLIWV